MKTHMLVLGVFALFVLAAPARAQDEDTGTMVEETADPAAMETDEIEADAAETPVHDWEFVLQSTDNAPGGGGIVKVTEIDDEQSFTLDVEGLPLIDDLDNEDRDVNAYTVWIVPSKDKVKESALAGVVTVGPEGTGSFEGTTSLETFGVIVTATADGAPETITGVPVLTGIPVTNTPVETAETAENAAEEAVETAENAEENAEDTIDDAEAVEDDAEQAVDEAEEEVEDASQEGGY